MIRVRDMEVKAVFQPWCVPSHWRAYYRAAFGPFRLWRRVYKPMRFATAGAALEAAAAQSEVLA